MPHGDGNLTDRLVKMSDLREVADDLYVTVLSRSPSEAEAQEVADYLANRAAAAREFAWALFCSTEFRFNH